MISRVFQHRTIWWPTRLGWLILFIVFGIPLIYWVFFGETFLSVTAREPADVLVVEGWIGLDGVHAAKVEFEQGCYQYIVTAGALTNTRWDVHQWNYAIEARKLLLREGVPADRVIAAPAQETKSQRTFATAVAVSQVLATNGLHPATINVFTLGVHARRSRLIFAKVLPSGIKVGAISWIPPTYQANSWWKSSERADDLLKETAGYWFELLLNSGRRSNAPPPARP